MLIDVYEETTSSAQQRQAGHKIPGTSMIGSGMNHIEPKNAGAYSVQAGYDL